METIFLFKQLALHSNRNDRSWADIRIFIETSRDLLKQHFSYYEGGLMAEACQHFKLIKILISPLRPGIAKQCQTILNYFTFKNNSKY